MANTFRQEAYRSAKVLGYLVTALLGFVGICTALEFILSVAMIAFPDTMIDLDEEGSMNASLLAIGLIELLNIPLRIVCAIVFLM